MRYSDAQQRFHHFALHPLRCSWAPQGPQPALVPAHSPQEFMDSFRPKALYFYKKGVCIFLLLRLYRVGLVAEPQATPLQVARRTESFAMPSSPGEKQRVTVEKEVQCLRVFSSPRGVTFLDQLLSHSITETFPAAPGPHFAEKQPPCP